MSDRRRLHRSSGIYKAFASNEVHYPKDIMPLQTAHSLERWQHLAQGMNTLAQNIHLLARIHSALADKFNESFASFLYGLLITMFCNNFPESPNKELYEHKSIKGLSLRIDTLQDRVRMAKAKNQQLRSEVERRNRQATPGQGLFAKAESRRADTRLKITEPPRLETPTRHHPRNPLFQKPVPKALMVHKQPNQRLATGAAVSLQKFSVAHDDTYSTNDSFLEMPIADPNLNQPPRYMQGLFDKSASANTRRSAARPPLGKPQRVSKPARGSAAQRAQRARENRLNMRPPFR